MAPYRYGYTTAAPASPGPTLAKGSPVTAAGVLLSRLLPPRLPPGCLSRDDLVGRLVEGLSGCRFVSVLAGAGYGKSTLLAQAVARGRLPWVWCSCDDRLASPPLLLAHMGAGIAQRFPGFGAQLELEGPAEDQVIALCNEVVQTIPDEFVLVLDDVHTVQGEAAETLGLVIRSLPATVHLALAGRAPLPFPLGRLRAEGVLEIGEADLRLSEEEATELVSLVGLAVEPGALSELHRRTEGWVAGLVLGAHSADGLNGARGLAQDHLFEYLAEEVLLSQPPELQAFLLDTAPLERFTPAVAAAVASVPNAGEIARDLVARHLFIVRLEAEGEWYRYHHLFQDFLLRRLEERDPGRVEELHRRAAAAWLACGERTEAVRHLLAARDHAAAADALEPIADQLLLSPDATTLASWLAEIPEQVWSQRPGLILTQASLLFVTADHDAALTGLERAVDELLRRGDHDRASTALFRLLQALQGAGRRHDRGIEVGERFVPRFEPTARMLPVARVLLAGSYGWACRFEDAEQELEEALRLPGAATFPGLPDYAAVIHAHYVDRLQGHIDEALASLEAAIARLDSYQDDDTPGGWHGRAAIRTFLLYARLYRSIDLNLVGRYEEALAEGTRLDEVAERRGFTRAIARTVSFIRATALSGLERWDDLAAELEHEGPGRLQGTLYAYLFHAQSARLAAHRGDAAAVSAGIAAAKAEIENHCVGFDQAGVLCDLALAAWRVGRAEDARALAEHARVTAEEKGRPWGRARAALVGTVVWGSGERGDGLLADALELSDRPGFAQLWTRKEREFAGPLLARALAHGLGPPDRAAELAAACAGEVVSEAAALLESTPAETQAEAPETAGDAAGVDGEATFQPFDDLDGAVGPTDGSTEFGAPARPPLRFVSLGGFAVRRGEAPVPTRAFGRERARALLAALLCAGAPVHREQLLEWFWPELPPDRAMRAFHVTLYALRRALEPELARGAGSSVVETDGETYRVILSERDTWDAADFLALAAIAARSEDDRARLARLQEAEAAFAGTLFPEWPYAAWSEARRVEVEGAHHTVLESIAKLSAAAGQHGAAITRYLRLIALEPEREAWHRSLMQVYAQAGARALALRQYHACRSVLLRELGVEPSPETRALYQELLDDRKAKTARVAEPATRS